MIQESIQTRASPRQVWEVWKRASYWESNDGSFSQGQYGKAYASPKKGAAFQILSIEEGKAFTLEWRAPCVKIRVNHRVEPHYGGAMITYQFVLTGFLSWPIEWLLKKKIRSHLQKALKEFVQILEH